MQTAIDLFTVRCLEKPLPMILERVAEAAYRADETKRVVDVDELLEGASARSTRTAVETVRD
ncbi:hypothetical protein [Halomontanus rarus]|uniref:hypothetical protein n=1 Tax=Halomontanus rarus TaxID=3034020 RepID=UPI001A985D78